MQIGRVSGFRPVRLRQGDDGQGGLIRGYCHRTPTDLYNGQTYYKYDIHLKED